MKSEKINVILVDQFRIQIPAKHPETFAQTKDQRDKFIMKHKANQI